MLEKILTSNHAKVAEAIHFLAKISLKQGLHNGNNIIIIIEQIWIISTDAEKGFKKALTLREDLLGKQHIDVAASCNELGYLYTSQVHCILYI